MLQNELKSALKTHFLHSKTKSDSTWILNNSIPHVCKESTRAQNRSTLVNKLKHASGNPWAFKASPARNEYEMYWGEYFNIFVSLSLQKKSYKHTQRHTIDLSIRWRASSVLKLHIYDSLECETASCIQPVAECSTAADKSGWQKLHKIPNARHEWALQIIHEIFVNSNWLWLWQAELELAFNTHTNSNVWEMSNQSQSTIRGSMHATLVALVRSIDFFSRTTVESTTAAWCAALQLVHTISWFDCKLATRCEVVLGQLIIRFKLMDSSL